MSGNVKGKQKLPDHVVAPEGTNLFRAINFERYAVRSALDTCSEPCSTGDHPPSDVA